MHIQEIDPRDDAAFAAWFAVVEASEQHDRPGEPDDLLHEQRAISLAGTRPDADSRCVLLCAREGGDVVGAVRMELPQRDNLHLCELVFCVHPSARRRGAGRALAAEVERRVRALGRTTLLSYGDEPPGQPTPNGNRLAARALGYELVQQEVRRDIVLPLEPARVQELEASCRPYAADYTFRTWWDRCPDELVDDRAALSRAMSTDIPKDQMDWREEVWDAARVRRNETRTAEMDRAFVCAGAVHQPSGRLVAYTDMGLQRTERRRAYQWDTLVLKEHRGHRLGMLVKLAALQELTATSPTTAFISTWNAQENGPMIAVNEALGARTNGRLAVLQKVLKD